MLITSELTNQSARKALFTCVVYTKTNYCGFFCEGFFEGGLVRSWFELLYDGRCTELTVAVKFQQELEYKSVHCLSGREKSSVLFLLIKTEPRSYYMTCTD